MRTHHAASSPRKPLDIAIRCVDMLSRVLLAVLVLVAIVLLHTLITWPDGFPNVVTCASSALNVLVFLLWFLVTRQVFWLLTEVRQKGMPFVENGSRRLRTIAVLLALLPVLGIISSCLLRSMYYERLIVPSGISVGSWGFPSAMDWELMRYRALGESVWLTLEDGSSVIINDTTVSIPIDAFLLAGMVFATSFAFEHGLQLQQDDDATI